MESIKAHNYTLLAEKIRHWAQELGFQQARISDVALKHAEPGLQRWLDAGCHGEMDYMQRHGMMRCRPDELVPGTLRVISLRMNYTPPKAKDGWQVLQQADQAYISRYALGRDYHKVLRKRLAQLADNIAQYAPEFSGRVFTDSAPLLEVELAKRAGLGWRGKHTLLLTREHGSWFFLGEVLVNLPLPVDPPVSDHCGECQRCLDICPTQAIVAPYQLDARRCISYLTIEYKGHIPLELRPAMGNRIYGCDDCQLICPWNRFAQHTQEIDFHVRHGLDAISLLELFAWDEAEFKQKMAGSPIYRIGYLQWLRNIAVALGNAPYSEAIITALQNRQQHESELVREHVQWALDRLMVNHRSFSEILPGKRDKPTF